MAGTTTRSRSTPSCVFSACHSWCFSLAFGGAPQVMVQTVTLDPSPGFSATDCFSSFGYAAYPGCTPLSFGARSGFGASGCGM